MSKGETAVLVMTDIHYGKKTKNFSPDLVKRRLAAVGRRMGEIRAEHPAAESLTVALLGDVNDGTDIYKTQPHHQAITNVEEQADDIAGILANWCKEQAEIWGRLDIYAVPGNHGRAGQAAHEAASWDMVAYRYLSHRLQINRTSAELRTNAKGNVMLFPVTVRRHKLLLHHGHAIKSWSGIPWYGISTRLQRWSTTGLAPFQALLLGHFHTFGYWSVNRVAVLASGTMITGDDWALQDLGWESANRWWLFGASERELFAWQYGLDLTNV